MTERRRNKRQETEVQLDQVAHRKDMKHHVFELQVWKTKSQFTGMEIDSSGIGGWCHVGYMGQVMSEDEAEFASALMKMPLGVRVVTRIPNWELLSVRLDKKCAESAAANHRGVGRIYYPAHTHSNTGKKCYEIQARDEYKGYEECSAEDSDEPYSDYGAPPPWVHVCYTLDRGIDTDTLRYVLRDWDKEVLWNGNGRLRYREPC